MVLVFRYGEIRTESLDLQTASEAFPQLHEVEGAVLVEVFVEEVGPFQK